MCRRFQSKGMDIGVADDSLNGIPFEESSESEEEEEIEESEGIIRNNKRNDDKIKKKEFKCPSCQLRAV